MDQTGGSVDSYTDENRLLDSSTTYMGASSSAAPRLVSEVDTSIGTNDTKEETVLLEGSQIHKKLMDEERAMLKLLGLFYFCRGGKYLSTNCPEKPPQQNLGQDRRALPGKPPVRPPPNKWNKLKVRSAETDGEQILLTREYVQQNFQDMVLLLNKEE